jgi:magnesium transporter
MNHKIQKHCQRIDGMRQCSIQEIDFTQIARSLTKLRRYDRGLYFSNLSKIPPHQLIYVLLQVPNSLLESAISHFPIHRLVLALKDVQSDDATDFMQRVRAIDSDFADRLLSALHPEEKKEIDELGKYRENEAGAYMQLEVFTAFLDESVATVIDHFKTFKISEPNSNIQSVFIINPQRRLLYSFNIEELLLFEDEQTMQDIVTILKLREPIAIHAKAPLPEVIHLFQEYDLKSIPIVTHAGKLKGHITYDDIYDLIREMDTDQLYAFSGLKDEAEEEEDVRTAGNKRLVWLFINLATVFAAAVVIGLFKETIAAYVALAVLMPVVAALGGNAGMQALTVTVRRLALGEISFVDTKEVLRREVLIVLRNGLVIAASVGLVASLWFDNEKLGVIIAMAMLLNLLAAGTFGTLIPLGLKKIHIDPAVASTVLLTTVADTFGFFVFLGLAYLFL